MEEVVEKIAAATADKAEGVIRALIKECVEGSSDREGEALALASEWGIDEQPVKVRFADARKARAEEAAAKATETLDWLEAGGREAAFFSTAAQPNVALTAKVAEGKPKPSWKLKPLGKPALSDLLNKHLPCAEPEATGEQKVLAEAAVLQDKIAGLQDQVASKKVEASGLVVTNLHRLLLTPSQAALKPEQAIKEMNTKHAVISRLGGKVVVMEWVTSEIDPAWDEPEYQSFRSFRERYSSRYVEVVDMTGKAQRTAAEPMGSWWLANPARRQYESLDLEPNGPLVLPGNRLNLWRSGALNRRGESGPCWSGTFTKCWRQASKLRRLTSKTQLPGSFKTLVSGRRWPVRSKERKGLGREFGFTLC